MVYPSSRRRRRLRLTGQLFYVLAAALVLVGAVTIVRDDQRKSPRIAASSPTTSATVARPVGVTTPLGQTTATTSDAVALTNTPPVISGSHVMTVRAAGTSPLSPLSLDDREARPGELFGVLVYSAEGDISVGSANGVRLLATNGARWLPFEGPLGAIRTALASLRYTPEAGHRTYHLTVIASDYGHESRFALRSSSFAVTLTVGP